MRILLCIATAFLTISCGASFDKWAPQDAVSAFQQAGLPCENVRLMTKEDYGFAPMVAKEATRFYLPALCEDCGGRVFTFTSQDDLEKTRLYYVTLGRESAAFYSYTLVKDNLLVQINGNLPPEEVARYQTALDTLK